MPILEPYIAAGDVYVLPSYLPVPDVPAPGLGTIVINSYLIRAAEPILIDAGMPVVKEDFLKALWELIDPKDLGAVLLTHDDGDHTGALMEVLEAAPQARLYTQFVGLARLETAHHLPIERVGIVNPGQTFTHGGRELAILRPPLFDSPATNAYFDPKSGVLFSADSFGALIPRPAQDVGDVGDAAYADGFNLFNRLNHPWFELVDPAKFVKNLGSDPPLGTKCHRQLSLAHGAWPYGGAPGGHEQDSLHGPHPSARPESAGLHSRPNPGRKQPPRLASGTAPQGAPDDTAEHHQPLDLAGRSRVCPGQRYQQHPTLITVITVLRADRRRRSRQLQYCRGTAEQITASLDDLETVLGEAGLAMADVAHPNNYTTDMGRFGLMLEF